MSSRHALVYISKTKTKSYKKKTSLKFNSSANFFFFSVFIKLQFVVAECACDALSMKNSAPKRNQIIGVKLANLKKIKCTTQNDEWKMECFHIGRFNAVVNFFYCMIRCKQNYADLLHKHKPSWGNWFQVHENASFYGFFLCSLAKIHLINWNAISKN